MVTHLHMPFVEKARQKKRRACSRPPPPHTHLSLSAGNEKRPTLTPPFIPTPNNTTQELEAEGVALLVDDAPDTPWDLLLPSRVGGMERLRLAETHLRPGQVVATLPEPLTHRRNFALLARKAAASGRAAAKRVWAATPPVFALPQDKAAWLDAGNAEPASRWILKSGSKGHPAKGHDSGGLSEMAAAAMLPVTTYELAQQVVAPPALPLVLGERATMR